MHLRSVSPCECGTFAMCCGHWSGLVVSDLVPGVRLCCVLPVQPAVLALMEHVTYIVGTGVFGELL